MVGTYASLLAILGVAALIGQALSSASGSRAPSALAPALGLAAAIGLAWGAVHLPGRGVAVLVALAVAGILAAVYLVGRVDLDPRRLLAVGAPVAALAAVAASLPFAVSGRFGILGTGLNPDMSQHLLATERLAAGGSDRLLEEGYPLGPHALVAGIAELGPNTVEAFGGLAIAIAIATCLAPLAMLAGLRRSWRIAAALTIGFAYLVASYLVQGAFKEQLQALFVLAFAVGLHRLVADWDRDLPAPRALRALPLAAIAAGSAYAYSFPGLAWLAGALGAWAAIELARALRRGGMGDARRSVAAVAPAAIGAGAVLVAALAPEMARMIDFARFETFAPDGPGLGNLFGRISPLEALGIWPSGDFRVEPGGGFAPALAFYLGALLAAASLALGLARWLGRGERAVPAALLAAAALWLYSLTSGTPYQEAKALAIAAPLAALIAIRGLALEGPRPLAVAYAAAAGACSALVLVNGPVGPAAYSPALADLRPTLGPGSTLVLADDELISERHGRDYLVWELRGNRICVGERARDGGAQPPAPAVAGPVARVVVVLEVGARGAPPPDPGAPAGFRLASEGPGYLVYESIEGDEGLGSCPFIPDGSRAEVSSGSSR